MVIFCPRCRFECPFLATPTFNSSFISQLSSYIDLPSLLINQVSPNVLYQSSLTTNSTFYARTGAWSFSTPNSKRNFSDTLSKYIILSFKPWLLYCLIADTPINLSCPSNHIFHHSQINLHCMISSYLLRELSEVPGATHFSYMTYNSIYFVYAFEHIDAIYLPPSSLSRSPIPDKISFLLSDNLDCLDTSKLDIYLEYFNSYIFSRDSGCSPFPTFILMILVL